MPRYSEEIIEQVRESNDIVDVIGQYVRLTKKGANYFGLCPFHGEKTASFSVSPAKQIYYCFGCGAGGNVINFLMEYENLSFTEALKVLADRVGITLPEGGGNESYGLSALKKRLYEINKDAAYFYYDRLKSPEGAAGLSYLKDKRELSERTITHFGLGYSGKDRGRLYAFLKEKGYTDQELKDSGLVIFDEKQINDRFWNRVMFPIMDQNSRVVGFGGRVMGDGQPKYLNSPETPIFDKSSVLYGLNFAKKSRKKVYLLCEGYMDVIALHQAGLTNAVASLGTAFNEKHARLLKRYTDEVILTQDSDEAGIKAKLRAFPILRDAGLNVRILEMKGYKDPDEFIKAKGPEAYEELIRKAKNAFMYEAEVIRSRYDLSDPAMKTKFYDELAEKLCMFTEPLERDNYVQAVSHEYMINYEELKKLTEYKFLKASGKKKSEPSYFEKQRMGLEERRPVRESFRDNAKAGAGAGTGAGTGADGTGGAGIDPGRNAGGYTDGNVRGSAAEGFGGNSREKRMEPKREGRGKNASLKAQRLLLSWCCVSPAVLKTVSEALTEEEFEEGVNREVYREILRESREGDISPSRLMELYPEDEEKRRLLGLIINYDTGYKSPDDMSLQELSKAVTVSVQSIKSDILDQEIEDCGDDIDRLQQLFAKKNELLKLSLKPGG